MITLVKYINPRDFYCLDRRIRSPFEKMMKKYASILFLALIIPSLAYASWWNPFTWNWNPFSWLAVIIAPPNHSTVESSNPSAAQTLETVTSTQTPQAPKKSAPVLIRESGGVPAEAIASSAPPSKRFISDEAAQNKVLQIETSTMIVGPVAPPNTTQCNGAYYTACPAGENFVCPTDGGHAYCQNAVYAALQKVIDEQNAQYQQLVQQQQERQQEMRAELSPVQAQLDALQAQENSQCDPSVFRTGRAAVNCMNLDVQMMKLQNQESAIINKYALLGGASADSLVKSQLPASNYWQITSSDGGMSGMVSNPFGSQTYQFTCTSPGNCTVFSP